MISTSTAFVSTKASAASALQRAHKAGKWGTNWINYRSWSWRKENWTFGKFVKLWTLLLLWERVSTHLGGWQQKNSNSFMSRWWGLGYCQSGNDMESHATSTYRYLPCGQDIWDVTNLKMAQKRWNRLLHYHYNPQSSYKYLDTRCSHGQKLGAAHESLAPEEHRYTSRPKDLCIIW